MSAKEYNKAIALLAFTIAWAEGEPCLLLAEAGE